MLYAGCDSLFGPEPYAYKYDRFVKKPEQHKYDSRKRLPYIIIQN